MPVFNRSFKNLKFVTAKNYPKSDSYETTFGIASLPSFFRKNINSFNIYIYENDYKMNVENDFKDTDYKLPIDANIIYKSFGWKSWNDFLGLENEMSIRKIKSIIH